MKWARSKRTRVGLSLSSSSTSRLLPSRLLFSVDSFPPPVRRDPRPLDSTRETTHVCARESVHSRKKGKKEEEKEKRRGRERKKWSRHELLLVEKLEVFARCVSKQFCLLIGGVKGRKATPTLLPPPFVIIDERFYSRGPLCRVPELKTSMPAT